MRWMKCRAAPALIFLMSFLVPNLPGQVNTGKKVLTMGDYGRWRSIVGSSISDDGNWISYGYRRPEADDKEPDERKLYVNSLVSDQKYEIEFGIRPRFSDDSKWVAYMIDTPRQEAKKLREQKKPVLKKAELLNLESGKKVTWVNVAAIGFSKGSKVLAVKKPRSDGKSKHKGSDLIVRDLAKGIDNHVGSVADYSFNKPGTLLAYTRDAADKTGNGLYVMDLKTGLRRPLDQDDADYSRMTWAEEGAAIAVLKGREKKGFTHKENRLIAFTAMDKDEPERYELNPADAFDFPKDMVIGEKGTLEWNTDLNKVFFGIKEQVVKDEKNDKDKDKDKDAEPVSDLDIWHWKDKRIQSVQRARAERERNFTYRCVFNLKDRRFVRLTDETLRDITITRDGKWGIGRDEREYISDWKPLKADYYRVDTDTGKRELIFEALRRSMGVSPDSKHFLYWQDGHVWVYKIKDGKTLNLTQSAPLGFANQEYDYPSEKPSYGLAGWTKDGKAVILNHRYDLWRQPLDGATATNLTAGVGADREIRFRYVKLDNEERFIDLSKPIVLSAYGQWTKKSGLFKLDLGLQGKPGKTKPEELIFEDKRFGRLTKAKQADVYMATIESFEESPDVYISDGTFTSPRRMTDANPQQIEYKWGHRILFDFTNSGGKRLQGILAIPEDRKPDQRLPMLVNFYEKSSQNMHRYLAPRYARSSGGLLMESASKGYLLMQPDIHFNTGATGDDMLDCVEAAVAKVIEMGYADPDRIGLCGFSFSGYGAAYIATRSKMFAAVWAGAGVMDLPSDFHHLWGYSADRKAGSGSNAHQYDILGQQRMGTNPHDDFELYRDQSPVTHVREMNTPLLLLQGESDNTVAWIEAVEFYNAARFNGKNVIMLSYPGEGHGLSKRENRIDLTVRMHDFFDHHLMDKPAPEWMTHGVPFLKKPQ